MTSDNADQRYQQPPGSTSDNTEPADAGRSGWEPVGVSTRGGVAFHFCPATGQSPACGRIARTALAWHTALPAADVPVDLRCRLADCAAGYAALDREAGA